MTTDTLSRKASRYAGWSIFMGILTAAVGAAMIIYPFETATASTVLLGAALLVAAAAQLVFAFTSDTAGRFLLKTRGAARSRTGFAPSTPSASR